MAYVNSTRTTTYGVADRVTALVKSITTIMQRRATYAQTLRELQALSNRDLSDLGLSRSMIAEVAREAAYGK